MCIGTYTSKYLVPSFLLVDEAPLSLLGVFILLCQGRPLIPVVCRGTPCRYKGHSLVYLSQETVNYADWRGIPVSYRCIDYNLQYLCVCLGCHGACGNPYGDESSVVFIEGVL